MITTKSCYSLNSPLSLNVFVFIPFCMNHFLQAQLPTKCTGKLKILRIKKKEAYRDGIKRKGDKIGMGYMKHG